MNPDFFSLFLYDNDVDDDNTIMIVSVITVRQSDGKSKKPASQLRVEKIHVYNEKYKNVN